MSKIITILKNLRYVPGFIKHQKQANADNDKKFPMNAYPPVYEADEQLRLTIAVTIVVSGAGLVALGLSGFQKLQVLNIYALVYGGSIIFFAFLYLTSTATRLRYQNPGEAQIWYVSESGRRQSYDNMVEMFWAGLWFGVEFSAPLYIFASIRNHWLGAIAALIWLIFVNLYIAMIKDVGMDYDRKTGNLIYDHNRKKRTAKEKREPFDAPPIKRNKST